MEGGARLFGAAGALFALLGVAMGAFGAHAVGARLDERSLEVFDTAVRYHLIHAVALVLVSLHVARQPDDAGIAAAWAFSAGIIIFSGSLYLLSLTGVTRWGAVTPIGGLAFLAGWLLLALSFLRG